MIDEMNSAAKVPPAGSYKLVVFDWDGTILDTTAAIAISIQYAAEKMGPSATKARSVIGLGWRDAMKIIAPTCPEEEFPQFGAYYVERYRPEEGKVHLFPGIENVIRTLHERGVTLAIATGKSRRGLNRVLEDSENTLLIRKRPTKTRRSPIRECSKPSALRPGLNPPTRSWWATQRTTSAWPMPGAAARSA